MLGLDLGDDRVAYPALPDPHQNQAIYIIYMTAVYAFKAIERDTIRWPHDAAGRRSPSDVAVPWAVGGADLMRCCPAQVETWNDLMRGHSNLKAISFDRVAKGAAQRTEPRLEVPPLVEPLAKDWLANLLGARRADATLRLVIFDAGRFEGQAAKPEDAADAAF